MKWSARVWQWLVIGLFGILAACDFYSWNEAHIRVLSDEQSLGQLGIEVARVLVAEGYEEWKDPTYRSQRSNVRIFLIHFKKGDDAKMELREDPAGQTVTLVYRQVWARRRFTAYDGSPGFTEAADKALQSLLQRLRETFGEKRVIVDAMR